MRLVHRTCATWIAGILSIVVPTAASAVEVVVVEARGGSFKTGDKIDGNAPITLAAGQKLSLIAQNGATIRLRGPFEGPPAPDSAVERGDVATALLNLGRQTESTSTSLGVVRAGTEERIAPDARAMDITRPGHRCLMGDATAVLWWPDRSADTAKVEIMPADRSWSARATWPSNSDRMALPANLPLRDGQTYLFEINKVSAAVVVHLVPADLSTESVRAAWMLEKGCYGQAVALGRSESP
jgi:hypothetical protein